MMLIVKHGNNVIKIKAYVSHCLGGVFQILIVKIGKNAIKEITVFLKRDSAKQVLIVKIGKNVIYQTTYALQLRDSVTMMLSVNKMKYAIRHLMYVKLNPDFAIVI
ncbi:MAG: hypothetical protein QXI89_02190 [Candidatus Anstonellales archaeon]